MVKLLTTWLMIFWDFWLWTVCHKPFCMHSVHKQYDLWFIHSTLQEFSIDYHEDSLNLSPFSSSFQLSPTLVAHPLIPFRSAKIIFSTLCPTRFSVSVPDSISVLFYYYISMPGMGACSVYRVLVCLPWVQYQYGRYSPVPTGMGSVP